MSENKYSNYYKNHSSYNKIQINKNIFREFQMKISKYFKKYNKNISILEIGSGQGKFAGYCQKLGFKNYIGFDLDNHIVEKCKKEYPNYNFSSEDIYKYLEKNQNKFDVIFMSHVFEHIDDDNSGKLIKGIYGSLKKGGKWINIMPNANYILASYSRYNDITHKTLYNDNSFNQLLLENGIVLSNIKHYNIKVYSHNYLKFFLEFIIKYIRIFLLKILGAYRKIYTFEILSVIKK